MHSTLGRSALLLAATALLAGCFLFDLGTDSSLGVVHVEAALVENSCGPGIGVQGSSMEYDVELSLSGSTLTWSGPGSEAQGTFDEGDGSFCIEVTRSAHVRDSDEWAGDPGCDIVELERVCGTLTLAEEEDADGTTTTTVTAIDARHELGEAASTGSYCPEMIGISGGQVLTLPCQVVFDLTGVARDE